MQNLFSFGHLMQMQIQVKAPFRFPRMILRSALAISVFLHLGLPAAAIVGGAPLADPALARSVVTIVGSRGNFCSGALIAPDLVLSAAHCVSSDATYKLVSYDDKRQPKLLDVRRVALHPQFNPQSIFTHRASADVALLQLVEPMSAKAPALLGTPSEPIGVGRSFMVAGVGVAQYGDGKSGGTVRTARLVTTGRPGNLQIRLIDPATSNAREGLGACTGDSGAPVFEQQDAVIVIVGVVSWSTGAKNAAGCGGLTGVTPLTLYRNWIATTARNWSAR